MKARSALHALRVDSIDVMNRGTWYLNRELWNRISSASDTAGKSASPPRLPRPPSPLATPHLVSPRLVSLMLASREGRPPAITYSPRKASSPTMTGSSTRRIHTHIVAIWHRESPSSTHLLRRRRDDDAPSVHAHIHRSLFLVLCREERSLTNKRAPRDDGI